MKYEFRCEKCNIDLEREIKLNEYDTEKDKQICPICGQKLNRKYSVFIDRTVEGAFGYK